MSDIETTLDGAKLVQTYGYESWETQLVIVWKGGTQANVYSVYHGEWSSAECITVMDDSISRDEMSRRMDDWVENKTSCDVV